jgi:hypothetical protein
MRLDQPPFLVRNHLDNAPLALVFFSVLCRRERPVRNQLERLSAIDWNCRPQWSEFCIMVS